jgi:hypothetical protein
VTCTFEVANTFDRPPNLDPFESWAAAKSMNLAQLAVWADHDFAQTAAVRKISGLDDSEAIRKNQRFVTSGQSEAVNASARELACPPAGFAMQISSNRTEGIGSE